MADSDWLSPENSDEQEARDEAFRRLAAAARRAGYSIDRLHEMLSQVAANEAETRRFLSREVYDVSDDMLDDLIRVRLGDLERRGGEG